jgi:hypothetical protein
MDLINSIKNHLRKFNKLCVSLTRPQQKTELQENECKIIKLPSPQHNKLLNRNEILNDIEELRRLNKQTSKRFRFF